MSGKVVSLDIQTGESKVINVASMMPLSETSALNNHLGGFIDSVSSSRGDVDIFETPVIRVDRFSDIRTLDIANPKAFTRRFGQRRRKRYLNLIKPLYIPHGALDVRPMEPVTSKRKYSDLYTRQLSRSLMMRRRSNLLKRFLKRNRRGIVGTLTMAFLLSFPILWYVKVSIEDGYNKLLTLAHAQNITEAQYIIHDARVTFERAHFLFLPFSWIPLGPVDLANRASLGGLSLTRSIDTLLTLVPTETGSTIKQGNTGSTITPLYRANAKDIFPFARFGIDVPTDWIREHHSTLVQTIADIGDAATLYGGVVGDDDIATKMQRVGLGLSKVSSYLSWYLDHEGNILSMLGDENPARYIVFNQNRDEIRANGGFPGTVISFTFYKGNILDYREDDVYYYDWNLYPYKEQPPPGLALLSNNYGLRDVNYYPDFRDTVEKANSFIERSGDSTITTGIAIHQGIIEDMLKEIGPVTVSGVSIPFDNKNFSALMSTLVEAEYGRDLHAKTILFDFVNAFAKKINDAKKYDVVFDVLERYWRDGEILMASRDEATENFLSEFKKELPWECDIAVNSEQGTINNSGTTGALDTSFLSMTGNDNSTLQTSDIKPQVCARNWAYPIFTSIGGNKTDRYMEREYAASTKKIQGCMYENTVTISNTHTFSSLDKQAIKSYIKEFQITDPDMLQKIDFVEGNSPNKSFVRIFVPVGSALIGSGGSVRTDMGADATAFSFMLETPVGGTTSKTLHYTTEVPHCADFSGSVEWYRQPGLRKVKMK